MTSQEPAEHPFTLWDYVRVLERRRWVISSFFLISSVTALLGTLLMTPLYRGETSVLIEGESINVLRAEDSPASGTNFDIFESYLETQIALIKSKSVAGKVFDEFKLGETQRYRERTGLAKILRHHFKDDIELERKPGTRLLTISVYNWDPKLAADIANRLAEVYTQDNMKRRALTFIRNQRMGEMNADFLRLQSEYIRLSNQFGPKHPEMIALKNQIRAMSERLAKERVPEGVSSTEGAEPASEEQALLEETLLKIQESSVISSSRMSNIVIVDRARVSEEIAKPNRLLNIVLGILVGLAGGVMIAFLVDYLDDSIKSDEDLKRHIGDSHFLGSVFHEKAGRNNASSGPTEIDRLVALRSESPSAEAYRLIRLAIAWSHKKEIPTGDIAVLSAGPGEGKTTVASNLAITLAQSGGKVLLVDADVRKGRIHQIYGAPKEPGLAQYLVDEVPFSKVVHPTDVPGLEVVPCGQSAMNPSRLFTSPRLERFTKEARSGYEIVLYDTPPLAIISDASILASLVGCGFLVVRSGSTTARVLKRSLGILRESKTALIGIILNSADSSDTAYYRKYYRHS